MKYIEIIGATENNLKNIDVKIPYNKLTVITGLSGSGKSSLANGIIAGEGQRRFLETFSAFTRSKLAKTKHSDVTQIKNILPVITVGQTDIRTTKRSTSGTFSDLLPLIRTLFSRYNDNKWNISRSELSFNIEQGWCPVCKGLGIEEFIDINKIIKDPTKSLRNQALNITLPNGYTIYSQVTIDELNKVCISEGFDVDTPWNKLTDKQKNTILFGSKKVKVLYGKHSLESRMKWSGITAKPRDESYYRGIVPVMEDILKRDRNANILKFTSSRQCVECKGAGLNNKALSTIWHGYTINQICKLSFSNALELFHNTDISDNSEKVIVEQIISVLSRLCNLSLGHIAIDRPTETLSQGELRRIRFAQLNNSGLTGVLYVFDEPSIGLHPANVNPLIKTIRDLIQNGNTVLVVEHNSQIIKNADYIIELGPKAGEYGGEIIYTGSVSEILKYDKSPTGKFLSSKTNFNNKKLEPLSTFDIKITNANNIHNQNFKFARGVINVITGVSGAGKSTLVKHGLLKCDEFEDIIVVDQKPIGRTSRSNPATYTGLFDEIRKELALTNAAKETGLTKSHFSFNSNLGQCSYCKGTGNIKVGMYIFEDLVQVCPQCHGKRYKDDVLSVKISNYSMYDILNLSVNQAISIFKNNEKISTHLNILKKLGLGYIKLGQNSTTLSGGEAQRIKLAKYLYENPRKQILYILDEPSSGLHGNDINRLINTLQQLTQNKHTVVVVEHDDQIIKSADWIVDIGPLGGDDGGKCLFNGYLQDFLSTNSQTAINLNKNDVIKSLPHTSDNIALHLKGINTNNLKNINIKIPKKSVVAFEGVSGSGKSSLLIDTIHAIGQKMFIENLNSFKRSQLKLAANYNISKIIKISPTVAISSQLTKYNNQSTVGTLSGINDLIRILFSRFSTYPKTMVKRSIAEFSFNNESATCVVCQGTGVQKIVDTDKIITNREKPLLKGALSDNTILKMLLDNNQKYKWLLHTMCTNHEINIDLPWNELSEEHKNKILYGTNDIEYNVEWQYKRKNNTGTHTFTDKWEGITGFIKNQYLAHLNSQKGQTALKLFKNIKCKKCNGTRFNSDVLQYKVNNLSISEFYGKTISQLVEIINNNFFNSIDKNLIKLLKRKLEFINSVGVGYLTPDRDVSSLSTGEIKWLRLSSLLSNELSGLIIILDEPSAGLDSNGIKHLKQLIKQLKDNGNTVLFSDHNIDMIMSADKIMTLGPLAGKNGGNLSETTKTYYKAKTVQREQNDNKNNKVDKTQIKKWNLPMLSSPIILERINLISGSTGTGKSTLLKKIAQLENHIDSKIVLINNTKTVNTKGIIADYLSFTNTLKKAYSQTPEAKELGLKPSDFSHNSKSHQCKNCKGKGVLNTTFDFLPETSSICNICNGSGVDKTIESIKLNNLNITEQLNKSIDEVIDDINIPNKQKNELLFIKEFELSYLPLNTKLNTLSTGEHQRLTLSIKLFKEIKHKSIILIDNPTLGLNINNINNLQKTFTQLTNQGHTIIIADNNELISKHSINTIMLKPNIIR